MQGSATFCTATQQEVHDGGINLTRFLGVAWEPSLPAGISTSKGIQMGQILAIVLVGKYLNRRGGYGDAVTYKTSV